MPGTFFCRTGFPEHGSGLAYRGRVDSGHIASVSAAHMIARKAFITERVWLSELPLLVLMPGYTFVGLAVLVLPLALH